MILNAFRVLRFVGPDRTPAAAPMAAPGRPRFRGWAIVTPHRANTPSANQVSPASSGPMIARCEYRV